MVNSFATKEQYTSHYKMLAFLSSLGVKVTLLRGFKFSQTSFIKPYVKYCASQRKKATNDAEKRMWKVFLNYLLT